jgi:hypothetical protein
LLCANMIHARSPGSVFQNMRHKQHMAFFAIQELPVSKRPLSLGWRIGVGLAKRVNQDSDGSNRAGLCGDANGSERSAENENECTR